MTIKKTAKQMSLATGACSALAILAFGTSAFALATVTPPAAPANESNIPRHYGIYKGDKIDVLSYQPTCPSFSIGMDAAAIQESASRAFVEAEDRRFKSIRDSWDAFEDCLTENARRDIEAVRQNLGDALSKAANDEATIFNAMNAAATANIERISKLPAPKAPKPPRGGAPAAAAAAPPASTLSAWTPPTGRMVGSLSGPAQSPVYVSGCPQALGALTPESFNTETSRAGFNTLLDELRALPERINQVRTCRQENGQEDYEAVQKAVTDGVNAVFVPRKTAFEREYAAVRFQLNEHRKPGGLLAAPEMGRAKPKAATKAKAKAKSR
jgi:hypothetical protein